MSNMDNRGAEPISTLSQKCNFPYYHGPHTQIVVTTGLAARLFIWSCGGNNPEEN